MIEFALVRDNGARGKGKAREIVGRRHFAEGETPPELAASKGRWVPVEAVDPPFDPAWQVKGAAAETIEAGRVVVSADVRDKTAEEIAGEAVAKVAEIRAEAARRIAGLWDEA